jgi:hypothetical protein
MRRYASEAYLRRSATEDLKTNPRSHPARLADRAVTYINAPRA